MTCKLIKNPNGYVTEHYSYQNSNSNIGANSYDYILSCFKFIGSSKKLKENNSKNSIPKASESKFSI